MLAVTVAPLAMTKAVLLEELSAPRALARPRVNVPEATNVVPLYALRPLNVTAPVVLMPPSPLMTPENVPEPISNTAVLAPNKTLFPVAPFRLTKFC